MSNVMKLAKYMDGLRAVAPNATPDEYLLVVGGMLIFIAQNTSDSLAFLKGAIKFLEDEVTRAQRTVDKGDTDPTPPAEKD